MFGLNKKDVRKRFEDFHRARIKKIDPAFTDSEDVDGFSFDYVNYHKDLNGALRVIESIIFYKRLDKQYFKNVDAPNFYDMIPKQLRSHYPKAAETLENRIAKKIWGMDIENQGGAASIPADISNIINNRDKFFSEIKKQSKEDIIDLRKLGHLCYNSVEGYLAYLKTINNPDYTINDSANALFHSLLEKGVFDDDRPAKITVLFPGSGFLEREWAKDILKRNNRYDNFTCSGNIKFLDASGLFNHYVFSDITVQHHSGNITAEYIMNSLGKELDPDRNNVIICNNALHSQDIVETERYMHAISQVISGKNAKLFLTIPTDGSTTQNTHYSSSKDYFAKHTQEEIMLLDEMQRQVIVPATFAQTEAYGKKIIIGYQIEGDTRHFDQYRTKSIKLKGQQRIYVHESNRYDRNKISDFKQMLNSEITQPIEGNVAFYKG